MTPCLGQNFGCTIAESQFIQNLQDEFGQPTEFARTLDQLNLFFTLLFTAELAVNAFSHWFHPFIQNSWSILDTFIVAMSLMSLIVTNQPTGIVRILRALRVIRLFGRVASLKKIISALTMALLPVLNVFLILFLLMGICELPHRSTPEPCSQHYQSRLNSIPRTGGVRQCG
jgi:hypothetical protein